MSKLLQVFNAHLTLAWAPACGLSAHLIQLFVVALAEKAVDFFVGGCVRRRPVNENCRLNEWCV